MTTGLKIKEVGDHRTFTVTADDGDAVGPFIAGTAAEPNAALLDALGQSGPHRRTDIDRWQRRRCRDTDTRP
jgi:hypothetical protein